MAVHLPGARQVGAFLAGWRGLGRFWIGVLLALALIAVILQTLGPPFNVATRPTINSLAPAEPVQAAIPPAAPSKHDVPPPAPKTAGPRVRPGRDTPGPIADPDPALLVPYGAEPSMKLPRISLDGRMPMAVYASGFDPTTLRPRVGLLIAGIGMSESDTIAALKELPEGVTFAVSPYATNIDHLLDIARLTGHEYLLSIPMEPAGYPVNDPDDRYALMTSLPPSDNLKRLDWVLSRLGGYVGVTNGFGQLHGERLSGVADQFDSVLEDIAHRGLLFVDCRVAQPTLGHAWNRSVDLLIDDGPVNTTVLDERLDQLTHLALDKGSALGLISVPRPVTLARVAAWTTTLMAKGLALAPVSALVRPPAKTETEK